MTDAVRAPADVEAAPPRPQKVLVARHSALVRVTHWINVIALLLLLMSGLQIFNAHPKLYWGSHSTFAHPWLALRAEAKGEVLRGVTTIGSLKFDTTGVLGASTYDGVPQARGFPGWATLPGQRVLSIGRRWHFFWAWVFVLNGALYLLSGLIGGHLRGDLLPGRDQLKPAHIWHEVLDHARLRFPKGESARRYNVIQKLTYLIVILVLLPLMLGTGLTMSPAMDTAFPWLVDLFGGRQSARSIHFVAASLIVAFVAVHLVMVVLSGLWNNVRSMITGRYAIEEGVP
jgi:thiosulfate reductase cytochrome b subunit